MRRIGHFHWNRALETRKPPSLMAPPPSAHPQSIIKQTYRESWCALYPRGRDGRTLSGNVWKENIPSHPPPPPTTVVCVRLRALYYDWVARVVVVGVSRGFFPRSGSSPSTPKYKQSRACTPDLPSTAERRVTIRAFPDCRVEKMYSRSGQTPQCPRCLLYHVPRSNSRALSSCEGGLGM